jgi:hypothetical protein
MTEKFNLSKKKQFIELDGIHSFYAYPEEDVKRFINLIEAKVFMDWKGQNEFIEWLKEKAGDELTK